jgi:hypothetical protein
MEIIIKPQLQLAGKFSIRLKVTEVHLIIIVTVINPFSGSSRLRVGSLVAANRLWKDLFSLGKHLDDVPLGRNRCSFGIRVRIQDRWGASRFWGGKGILRIDRCTCLHRRARSGWRSGGRSSCLRFLLLATGSEQDQERKEAKQVGCAIRVAS